MVAWAVTICAGSAFSAAGNLLPSPGFEQVDEATGYPLHWQPVWGKPTTCAYTLAKARTGVAAALITDGGKLESHGLRSEHVGVKPGRSYEATVFVRIEGGSNPSFALYLEFWNSAKVRGLHKAVGTSQTGGWRCLRVRLKAPPDAHTATVLIYGGSTTVGKAYFDDAALVEKNPK